MMWKRDEVMDCTGGRMECKQRPWHGICGSDAFTGRVDPTDGD